MLTLILGGARSGKSRLAQQLAATYSRVIYVATAQANTDAEMVARIAHHRAHRPAEWTTVEAPLALAQAVEDAAQAVNATQQTGAVLVDCLTVWLSNLFWEYRDRETSHVEEAARHELQRIAVASRKIRVILVSNELGGGIVPESALARTFRDTQGLLNQWAAEAADEVILTVAGLPLYLKRAPNREAAQ